MPTIPSNDVAPVAETTTPVAEVQAPMNKKARRKAAQAAATTVPTDPTTPPVEGAPAAPATEKPKDPNALTGREALALHYIAGAPRIGAELAARMGKGISRMCGCSTKAEGVSPGLVGRGFLVVQNREAGEGGSRREYHITAAGRAALALAGDLAAAAAAGEAKAAEKAAATQAAKAAAAPTATTVPTEPAATPLPLALVAAAQAAS
jgi:hypothetical protein